MALLGFKETSRLLTMILDDSIFKETKAKKSSEYLSSFYLLMPSIILCRAKLRCDTEARDEVGNRGIIFSGEDGQGLARV